MLNRGTIVGDRYRIIDLIGQGGMAKVYKASDLKLNRNVAVKILNSDFSMDEKFVRKFQAEAQAAAMISNQNIVNVFDVGNQGNMHYIVMELVEGITLKDYIDARGPLNDSDTLKIVIQIAQGLEAAHHANIIHRDIKPENIVISNEGVVKVADFGIAKAPDSKTTVNAVAGSVHYMAPEQSRSGYSDIKSDIYSLGITMYEMITGDVPYNADSNVEVALSHMEKEMIPPSSIIPGVSPGLEQIVLCATQKAAANRYQNVGEMLRDLKFVYQHPGELLPTNYRGGKVSMDTVFYDENFTDELRMRHDYDDYDDYEEDTGAEVVNPKIKRIMNVLTIVGGVIVAFLLIFVIFKLGFSGGGNSEGRVPNLVGMQLEEAQRLASGNGFTVTVTSYDKTAPEEEEGKIKSQDPAPDAKWPDRENRVIKLVVAGTDELTIPDYASRPKDQVIKEIKDKGLQVKTEDIFDDRIAEGFVVKTDPPAGDSVPKGATVTVYVSKGKEIIKVPDVVGETKEKAIRKLTDKGLNVDTATTYGEENKVMRTNPKSGTELERGDVVTIYVGNGKRATTVPDVATLSAAGAREMIEAAKLVYVEEKMETNEQKPGTVVKTDPGAGTEVEEGSTVICYIAVEAKIAVPQLIGQTKEEATNLCVDAGLKITVQSDYSDDVPKGTVIRQSPEAGTLLNKDEAVAVTVSRGKKP
ncbi:MAG: Stk1 family PASTA domain-containing Ser/Thr kinase [Eubacteriales bacterium]|nr:Stk1 family PASTA domain-containing Ser/Thr kinase [Eubacteriales bacterium]